MFIELRRPGASPPDPSIPLFRLGFRPFFLAAAVFACLAIPVWLLVWTGRAALPGAMVPAAWHAHEMIYGFTAAVVAGFLLTAVRNWTGQPTPAGPPLVALVSLWAAGRVAMFVAGLVPAALVAVIDVAFLPAVALAIARPIIASRNWRNLAFVPILLVLAGANVVFHASPTNALPAMRVGVDVVLVVTVIISGRVIPMFTQNAVGITVVRYPWLDRAAIASTALVAILAATVGGVPTATAAILAGLLHALRLASWRGWTGHRMPILWVLHVGYAWVAIGFVLRGLSTFFPAWPITAPTHAVAVGAIAILILGMMSRVSLGHTGRTLLVPRSIAASYVALAAAAAVRALGPIVWPSAYAAELVVAGTLFTLAFAVFGVVYVPILSRPRADGRPG